MNGEDLKAKRQKLREREKTLRIRKAAGENVAAELKALKEDSERPTLERQLNDLKQKSDKLAELIKETESERVEEDKTS